MFDVFFILKLIVQEKRRIENECQRRGIWVFFLGYEIVRFMLERSRYYILKGNIKLFLNLEYTTFIFQLSLVIQVFFQQGSNQEYIVLIEWFRDWSGVFFIVKVYFMRLFYLFIGLIYKRQLYYGLCIKVMQFNVFRTCWV